MGQTERLTGPGCGAYLTLALRPGGKSKRTPQCFDCDGPDPLKTDTAAGWLKGELQPPKQFSLGRIKTADGWTEVSLLHRLDLKRPSASIAESYRADGSDLIQLKNLRQPFVGNRVVQLFAGLAVLNDDNGHRAIGRFVR